VSDGKLQAPRGTFDVLPEQAAARATVEREARRIFGAAGYGRIETPTFEATELFVRGVGESSDVVRKEMYSFDDGGGRSLTLRPEGTAPICRAYIEHGMHKLPQPVRLWYLSSFYRHEAPQAGRYRQFWQVGAEALGSDDPAVDAETILLLAELLDALGVRDLRLRLSSLGSPDARAAYRADLQAYLRAREAELSREARERIDLNPLRAFDTEDPATRTVMARAPLLLDRLDGDDAEHFAEVRALLDDVGMAYEVDPTLVRGLDYYTRTVFEFESRALGAQSGVGGGGRYDGLVAALGGPSAAGCGWAAGIERILLASGDATAAAGGPPAPAPPVDLFVAYEKASRRREAFRIVAEARRAGLGAQLELSGRSLKGQLRHADRAAAGFVAILRSDATVLRNMETGEQRDVAPEAVPAEVLRTRGIK
jgi:histidyl-tRNA synthetase